MLPEYLMNISHRCDCSRLRGIGPADIMIWILMFTLIANPSNLSVVFANYRMIPNYEEGFMFKFRINRQPTGH